MKRVLILASTATMICAFNIPNIELLQSLGYTVDVACNFKEGNNCSIETIKNFRKKLDDMSVCYYQIDFTRNVKNIFKNIIALLQVEQLIKKNNYYFLHCHSPIGGVAGRIAGKMRGIKVIYTAHGFHFFAGAPRINWLVYYPIERICSYLTDILITINKEDYNLARRKMKAKKVVYIPGVGIDMDKFALPVFDKLEKRKEFRNSIGCSETDLLLFSAGELNNRKNHEVVIRALAQIKDSHIHYAIAGKGSELHRLTQLSKDLGISDRIHFLGFRTDMAELYQVADIFCFPSKREGLGLAAIEAMSSGLPLITSNINGIKDYSIDGVTGYSCNPTDVNGFARAIYRLKENPSDREKIGRNNMQSTSKYSIENVQTIMKKIYSSI